MDQYANNKARANQVGVLTLVNEASIAWKNTEGDVNKTLAETKLSRVTLWRYRKNYPDKFPTKAELKKTATQNVAR